MPGKRRHGTVGLDSPSNVARPSIGITDGKATMNRLRQLFKPPVYPTSDSKDEYTDALMRKAAEQLLFSDKITEDPIMWGPEGVDRTFSGSPDIPKDVPTGGDGLPATAYTPNPGSPGPAPDGSVNVPTQGPTGQPNLDLPKDGGIPVGIDGRRNPKQEAASISDANKKDNGLVLGGHGSESAVKTY